MFSIRTNLASYAAQRSLGANQIELDRSLSRLASGTRFSGPGDDPAGLALSAKLRSQSVSYAAASRNIDLGTSMIQTTEGALNEASNLLSRLRELATESASDGSDRASIQTEASVLTTELDRLSASTQFNQTALFGSSFTFQVGIRNTTNDTISLDLSSVKVTTTALGIAGLNLGNDAFTSASELTRIDSAISTVNGFRATLGASANRLESAQASLTSTLESLTAAESRISDVDVAAETAALSRSQILVQTGIAVLAQANIKPAYALKLMSSLPG